MGLTRQEVFQALTEGKKIGLVPRLESCDWIGLDAHFKRLDDDVFESLNWSIEAETEPPKWYENIPEQGILCWVSDKNPKIKFGLACITKVEVGNYQEYVDRNDISWSYATPLTNEEIKQFLQGE